MAHTHPLREADCSSPARRYSSVLLLLAAASLLVACGGTGGAEVAGDSNSSGTNSLGTNTAILTWDAEAVSGYRVYYGTAPGTYLQLFGQGLNVGNVTTYTMTGLNGGTKYYFAVTAYDASNSESGYSNEVSKTFP